MNPTCDRACETRAARPQQRSWCTPLALLQLALAPCAAVAGGAELEIKESFREYPITATDARSLSEALEHQRPVDLESASSHALTEITLSSRLVVDDIVDGCAWTGPTVVLEMRTSLPSWSDKASAPAELRSQWSAIRRGLDVHEAGHRDLARETARTLLEKIRDIDEATYRGQPCREIQRKISALQTRALARLSLRQHAYDQRTRLGATQGAVLELRDAPKCERSARRARAGCSALSSSSCECRDESRPLPIGL